MKPKIIRLIRVKDMTFQTSAFLALAFTHCKRRPTMARRPDLAWETLTWVVSSVFIEALKEQLPTPDSISLNPRTTIPPPSHLQNLLQFQSNPIQSTAMDPDFRSKLFFSSTILLLLLCLIAPLQCRADSPLGYSCSSANYTKQSSASRNVKTVLNTLISASAKSGAYNTSAAGHGVDSIHGLLQCRGDATASQCHNCTAEASQFLESACAGKPGGRVWADLCYLRFDNSSFAGHVDTDQSLSLYNVQNVSDPKSFRRSMQGLMNNLSKKAVDGGDGFSAGSTSAAAKPRIYGLVQCTGDLSLHDCSRCLNTVLGVLYNFSAGRQGARRLTGSCNARYETYSFFNLSSASAAPSSSPSPSSPSMAPVSSPTPAAAFSSPSPSPTAAAFSSPSPSPTASAPAPSSPSPASPPGAEPPATSPPPPSSPSPASPPRAEPAASPPSSPPSHAPAPGSAPAPPGTSETPPPAPSSKAAAPREAFTWVVALVSIVAHALYALC